MELTPVPRRLNAASIAALGQRLHAPPAAGAPPCFALSGHCEGLDLEALVASDFSPDAAPLEPFAALLEALCRDPRPVIYLLDGPARGGGVALVAVADVVIASPAATLALPEVFHGLVPATVMPWLTRRVGPARALKMALGAPPSSASEALAIGLVDEVTPTPLAAAEAWAQRWARADARALAVVKRWSAGDPHLVDPPLRRQGGAGGGERLRSEQGVNDCLALLASAETRRRLALSAEGHAPWLGDAAGHER